MKDSFPYPTGPIKVIHGQCIYLQGNDIDTDRIIPARFLKCINFENLGDEVFADDRIEQKEAHPFNQYDRKNASILIVDKNFGCGSSREHAPQALMRWGIRGIIGQSFAEIFYGNCLSLGIPCANILEPEIKSLIKFVKQDSKLQLKLDLKAQKLFSSNQNTWDLNIEDGALDMLTSGRWDATLTLIKAKEAIQKKKQSLPYINDFNLYK